MKEVTSHAPALTNLNGLYSSDRKLVLWNVLALMREHNCWFFVKPGSPEKYGWKSCFCMAHLPLLLAEQHGL